MLRTEAQTHFTKEACFKSGRRCAAIFNLAYVLAHFLNDVVEVTVRHPFPHFGQSEMDDVVMMDFFSLQIFADLEPEAVQHVYFFRSEPGGMRSEIEYLFFTRRFEYFERDSGTRFRNSFPCKSDIAGLLSYRHF